jgi:DnaJ-class molecular chaperone
MASGIPDYYKALGVSRSATQAEIKKAWHKLAREYHPDAQRGKSDAERKAAETRMKEVNEAYSVIGDEEKRRQYDEYLDNPNPFASATQGGGAGSGSGQYWQWTSDGTTSRNVDWDEILRQVFGIGGNASAASGNGEHGGPFGGFGFDGGMGVSFGNAAYDSTHGTHRQDEQLRVNVPLGAAIRHDKVQIGLPSGKSVSVRIPQDVHDGTVMRLRGLGSDGGDLLLHIAIGVPSGYSLDGDDVTGNMDVRFDTAMLGGKTQITLPSGKRIELSIPKGTTAGRTFTFRGEGLGKSGRCVLKTQIIVPGRLSAKAEETLRELSREL